MLDLLIVSIYFNRENEVKESVQSVVSQLKSGYKLALVDDGSDDGTLQELLKFNVYDNVDVISKENTGFVKTIKEIIGRYNSKYIAIHGSGDLSLSNRFSSQLSFLEKHPNVVCVGCKIQKNYQGSFDGNLKSVYGVPFIKSFKFEIIKNNPYSHGEVMFLRSAYEQVGGYRDYFTYAQDRDLWCRLSTLGDFAVLDEILYERFVGTKGTVSGSAEKTLKQRYFSAFAVDLHEQYLKNGIVEFDKTISPLFFRNRKRLRKSLIHYSFSYLLKKQPKGASVFAKNYLNEEVSFIKRFLFTILFHSFLIFSKLWK